jgi:hypothetical protein
MSVYIRRISGAQDASDVNILGRLQYGYCLLVGLPAVHLRRLQSVQNAAARLICDLSRD